MANKKANNELPSITDFFKTEDEVIATYKPDQLENRALIMLSFTVEENQYGPYVTIRAADPTTHKELFINAYQESIMTPLIRHQADITLPCNFTIRKFGNSFQLA